MKLRLSPYGDNFMFIDTDLKLFMSIACPTATVEDEKVTSGIRAALAAGTLVEEKEEETTPPIPEPEPETKKKKTTKVKK